MKSFTSIEKPMDKVLLLPLNKKKGPGVVLSSNALSSVNLHPHPHSPPHPHNDRSSTDSNQNNSASVSPSTSSPSASSTSSSNNIGTWNNDVYHEQVPTVLPHWVSVASMVMAISSILYIIARPRKKRIDPKRCRYQEISDPTSASYAYSDVVSTSNPSMASQDRFHSQLPRRRIIPIQPPQKTHPGLPYPLPPDGILLDTQRRLVERGVRVMAHGLEGPPRPIWLLIDQEGLIWQKEYSIPYDSGTGARSSMVPMRGSQHRIPWNDIVYLDLGKKTISFQQSVIKRSTISDLVKSSCCFSILTANGSLDIETKSNLERDALVTCLGAILDRYKDDGSEWRNLCLPDDSSFSDLTTSTALTKVAGFAGEEKV